jgi:two-component system sensor histidine kinase CpxA
MRSLFIKIFLGFWLAMALTSIAYTFLALSTQIGQGGKLRQSVLADRRQIAGEMLTMFGQIAPILYEREGTAPLDRYTSKTAGTSEVLAYLFDATGRPLISNRDIPAAVQAVAVEAAQHGDLRSGNGKSYIALAQPVAGPAGRRYIAAVGMLAAPPWAAQRWQPIVRSFAIRMAVALFFGGIICYVLAWRLTAPIRRLRTAAQRLASGDLSARVGETLGKSGDEVADLGRDLDQMAERIETLMESQKRLVRDVSHELRSPLARFNVALGLARQHCSSAADSYFDRIERDAERLNELIGELLTLTLLESGTEQLAREPLSLDSLVAKVVQDAEFEAKNRGKSVSLISCEPLTVDGNSELLRRALENVVRNAVRYTREGLAAEISLLKVQEEGTVHAVISVRDYGPGVPEATLTKLFLPFYRVAEARDRQSGGTGIGLAITDRAVRLHNGTVNARNATGGGLLIEIRLPVTAVNSLAVP